MYCESAVLLRIPFLILLARARRHDVTRVLWVGLDYEPVVAEVTLAPELVYGRGVVVAYFLFLGVVAHAHANVVVAAITSRGVGATA